MDRRLETGEYFGNSTVLYERGGLALSATRFAGELDIPSHQHENPFFCLVLDGCGTRRWPGRAGEQAPMALTMFPAEMPHANHWHEGGGSVLHVEFSGSWLERMRESRALLSRPLDFDRGAPMLTARRLALETRVLDSASPLLIEGLVLELLGECARSRAAPTGAQLPARIRRLQELLHARFAERLDLDELADSSGVSPDFLAREFKRHTGSSIGDYVRQLRVEYVCNRLRGSRQSIAEIALAAGFSDQSHLNRVFRRLMRITPAAYRRATTD
ncbi:AraC family transcriptional regulator [Massilia endophytica]|uniref:AraC family transcriptional regulator n=1 Tax=Massilia endophytica TaxID=2899220 RepID=UPI001E2A3077|nr:AraC family transcriptional regulator [Massilia endophytica]UGQ44856.1 AraC family transcriptional regulator [Massilia endophytica]